MIVEALLVRALEAAVASTAYGKDDETRKRIFCEYMDYYWVQAGKRVTERDFSNWWMEKMNQHDGPFILLSGYRHYAQMHANRMAKVVEKEQSNNQSITSAGNKQMGHTDDSGDRLYAGIEGEDNTSTKHRLHNQFKMSLAMAQLYAGASEENISTVGPLTVIRRLRDIRSPIKATPAPQLTLITPRLPEDWGMVANVQETSSNTGFRDPSTDIKRVLHYLSRTKGVQPVVKSTEQYRALQACINREKNVLIVTPTNSGKSIVATHLPQCENGITLYCAPFKALLQDQERNLREQGIPFTTYDYNLKDPEQLKTNILLVQVEKMATPSFLSLARRLAHEGRLDRAIFDEAHAMQQLKFRQEMKMWREGVARVVAIYNVQIVGFTATLPLQLVENVKHQLGMDLNKKETKIVRSSVNRNELCFDVIKVNDKPGSEHPVGTNALHPNMAKAVITEVNGCKLQETNGKAIIFTMTKKTVTNVESELLKTSDATTQVFTWTATLDETEKAEALRKFKEAKGNSVLVSTSGTIPGIDVPGVVAVIFIGACYSLADLIQGGGRGSRGNDGKPCKVTVLRGIHSVWIQQIDPDGERLDDSNTTAKFEMRWIEKFLGWGQGSSEECCYRLMTNAYCDGEPVACIGHPGCQLCGVCRRRELQVPIAGNSSTEQLQDQRDQVRGALSTPPQNSSHAITSGMEVDRGNAALEKIRETPTQFGVAGEPDVQDHDEVFSLQEEVATSQGSLVGQGHGNAFSLQEEDVTLQGSLASYEVGDPILEESDPMEMLSWDSQPLSIPESVQLSTAAPDVDTGAEDPLTWAQDPHREGGQRIGPTRLYDDDDAASTPQPRDAGTLISERKRTASARSPEDPAKPPSNKRPAMKKTPLKIHHQQAGQQTGAVASAPHSQCGKADHKVPADQDAAESAESVPPRRRGQAVDDVPHQVIQQANPMPHGNAAPAMDNPYNRPAHQAPQQPRQQEAPLQQPRVFPVFARQQPVPENQDNREARFFRLFMDDFYTRNWCIVCAAITVNANLVLGVCTPTRRCRNTTPRQCFLCLSPTHRFESCPVKLAKASSPPRKRCFFCQISGEYHQQRKFGQGCTKGKQQDLLVKLVFVTRTNHPNTFSEIVQEMGHSGNSDKEESIVRFMERSAPPVYGTGGSNYMRFAALWRRRWHSAIERARP